MSAYTLPFTHEIGIVGFARLLTKAAVIAAVCPGAPRWSMAFYAAFWSSIPSGAGSLESEGVPGVCPPDQEGSSHSDTSHQCVSGEGVSTACLGYAPEVDNAVGGVILIVPAA